MPTAISKPARKLEKDIAKINTRLMEENMTLRRDIADQRKLIENMRARKSKAHRRLKALRELNKHVELLHAHVHSLMAQNELLRARLIAQRTPVTTPFFERIFGKVSW